MITILKCCVIMFVRREVLCKKMDQVSYFCLVCFKDTTLYFILLVLLYICIFFF